MFTFSFVLHFVHPKEQSEGIRVLHPRFCSRTCQPSTTSAESTEKRGCHSKGKTAWTCDDGEQREWCWRFQVEQQRHQRRGPQVESKGDAKQLSDPNVLSVFLLDFFFDLFFTTIQTSDPVEIPRDQRDIPRDHPKSRRSRSYFWGSTPRPISKRETSDPAQIPRDQWDSISI